MYTKFCLFVNCILAARNIHENRALNILNDAAEVFEKEITKNGVTCVDAAKEFVKWRLELSEKDLFESAPKWLSKNTVEKILLG